MKGVFGDCIWQLCYRSEMLKLSEGSAVPGEAAGRLVGLLRGAWQEVATCKH